MGLDRIATITNTLIYVILITFLKIIVIIRYLNIMNNIYFVSSKKTKTK